MHIIENNQFLEVPNNPDNCNNLGDKCHKPRSACPTCFYVRELTQNTHSNYETAHEHVFILKMGTAQFSPFHYDKRKCLEGYLESCKRRTRWGRINHLSAKAFVEKQLELLTN